MTPNIIGSSFILAETAITDANNNKNSTAAMPTPASVICPAAASVPVVLPCNKKLDESKVKALAAKDVKQRKPYQMEIVWGNVLLFIILHSSAFYGIYLIFAENAYLEFILCKYLNFFYSVLLQGGIIESP